MTVGGSPQRPVLSGNYSMSLFSKAVQVEVLAGTERRLAILENASASLPTAAPARQLKACSAASEPCPGWATSPRRPVNGDHDGRGRGGSAPDGTGTRLASLTTDPISNAVIP